MIITNSLLVPHSTPTSILIKMIEMKQLTCSDFLVLQLRTMLLFCIIIFSGYSTFAQKIQFEPVQDAGRQAGVYSQYFTKYAIGSIDRAQVASVLQSNQRF